MFTLQCENFHCELLRREPRLVPRSVALRSLRYSHTNYAANCGRAGLIYQAGPELVKPQQVATYVNIQQKCPGRKKNQNMIFHIFKDF